LPFTSSNVSKLSISINKFTADNNAHKDNYKILIRFTNRKIGATSTSINNLD